MLTSPTAWMHRRHPEYAQLMEEEFRLAQEEFRLNQDHMNAMYAPPLSIALRVGFTDARVLHLFCREWANRALVSRKKKQHKHKLFDPDFLQIFLTLTPGCPGGKKFLPTSHHEPAGKRTFWCGRPRFSTRTSMTRRVVEKLCTKKFALILGPYSNSALVKASLETLKCL